MATNNPKPKRKDSFFLVVFAVTLLLSVCRDVHGQNAKTESEDQRKKECPASLSAPPPVVDPDLPQVVRLLESLKDSKGRLIWKTTPESETELKEIFFSTPRKTKLEQFFQLLYLLQKQVDDKAMPLSVQPPGIAELLLAAKVFKEPSFPKKIISVDLERDDTNRPPRYRVQFSESEVRFPINEGHGFATWDQGMCQIAKELVFYPGFSFRLRNARNSKNLVVDDFQKVEIYGQFGTRKILTIDLNYVDLEKVEFIRGTDEGKVKARVAQREFKENEHSKLFKFIGTMIPNTSQQRIDW